LEDRKRQEIRKAHDFPILTREKKKILAKLSAYTYLYFCLLEIETSPQQKSFISLLQLVSSSNT